MSMKKKLLAIVAAALVVCCVAGVSFAWISSVSDPVENVFIVGDDIEIEIDEPEAEKTYPNHQFPIVPSVTYTKDPTITVGEGSAPMYLFAKVEKSSNLDDFVSYTIDSDWTQLKDGSSKDVPGVYYIKLATKTVTETEYSVLADDEVTVKDTVTKEMIDALTSATYPKLTFTAYAIQAEGMENAYDAWQKVQPAPAP